MFKELGPKLFKNGFEVIPIDGKRPVIKGWREIDITEEVVNEWALNGKGSLNVGIRCGDVYAADFDFYDKEVSDRISKDFVKEFGPSPVRIGQAPKKLMVYRGVEGQTKLKRSWRDDNDVTHGFELLGEGQQFAAYGEHPDTGKDYEWVSESLDDLETWELKSLNFEKVKAWIDAIEVPDSWTEVGSKTHSKVESDLGDFEGLIEDDFDKPSREELESYLVAIDNDIENDEWVKVGMGLYSWDSVEGLELWENWSAGGSSWKKGETAKRWKSFKDGVNITVGSVIWMAKHAGWAAPSFRGRLSECEDEGALRELALEIKESKIDALERNTLAALMKNMLKGFTGVPVPIADVRRLIAVDNVTNARARPKWCNKWAYALSHQQYFNLNTMIGYSASSFNLKCGVKVPENESGGKQPATSYVADGGYITMLDKIEYMPTEPDRIVGKRLNSYLHDLVPDIGERNTANEKIVVDHIVGLIGEDDAEVFIQWMAWQVQRTGELVRWSPIIVGEEGIGKSFFGELLKSALGPRHVGLVSPNTVKSQFNGWAEGVVVNVLQELKLTGHSRFDVANALKPLITDQDVEIHNKGLKPYVVSNVTNYMVFSNFKDAVPINTQDRRWWVSFAREHKLGHKYFTTLFAAVKNGQETRAWLESISIPDDFNSRAPMTAAKQHVIDTEKAMTDGLQEAEDLLLKGGEWWTENIFSSHEFRDELELEIGPIDNRSCNFLFKKLGFHQHGVVKIDGKARRIWAKVATTNKEIRSQIGSKA